MIRAALSAFVLSCALCVSAEEQRIALVIGNNAYQAGPLRNPVNDATAMAARLKAAGFDVTLRTDVTQRELTRSISQFGHALKPGAVALFYYAGHGMQVRGRNFLIPVDADIQSEATARSEGVDVDLLLEQLGPARLSMVVLDACRNNPFEGLTRSAGGSGLAQIDAPKGTLVAYATAPGRVAADGEAGNGTYTGELLKAIDVPGLKVEEVFKRVRVNVARATANQQIPWESSSLTGDFYFVADQRTLVTQNEVLKAVDEERRRRDQEARLFREEMQRLREEIRELRGASPQPNPPPQLALAQPATMAPPPAGLAVVQKPAAQATPAPAPPAEAKPEPPAVVVAKIDPAPMKDAGSKARNPLELLRRERGRLSFAKAMAILLAVEKDADFNRLLEADRAVKRMAYHSAIAMGVEAEGEIFWGRSGRFSIPHFAEKHALELCQRQGEGCRVIFFNGEMREDAFLELAADFGERDPTAARLRMLKRLPTE
ncbi:MAG TPA: caspase family protein [Usitatibacter sp.]|nr:caspase family protein [Usitatibacter sp.]